MSVSKEILEKVNKWTNFAEEDLRLAKHSLTLASNCPFRLTAYHAQQCAEKYLKAFLVYNQIDFPYTHSLTRLLELTSKSLKRDKLEEVGTLSVYAITTRYPGEDEEVSKEDAEEAIRLAEIVKKRIQEEFAKLM